MQPAESAQEDVVRAPASDPGALHERPNDLLVVERLEPVEIKLAAGRRARELENRVRLALAEPELPQLGRWQSQDVARGRERMQRPGGRSRRRGQPAENGQPGGKRQLLARDRVEQAFEQRREARRLQAPVALRQRAEGPVAGGARVEAGEVDLQTEQSGQRLGRGRLSRRRDTRAGERDSESRRIGAARLRHSDLDRPPLDHERATIRAPVPAVDRILLAPAQRPCGEVEPKRRPRVQPKQSLRGGARSCRCRHRAQCPCLPGAARGRCASRPGARLASSDHCSTAGISCTQTLRRSWRRSYLPIIQRQRRLGTPVNERAR